MNIVLFRRAPIGGRPASPDCYDVFYCRASSSPAAAPPSPQKYHSSPEPPCTKMTHGDMRTILIRRVCDIDTPPGHVTAIARRHIAYRRLKPRAKFITVVSHLPTRKNDDFAFASLTATSIEIPRQPRSASPSPKRRCTRHGAFRDSRDRLMEAAHYAAETTSP